MKIERKDAGGAGDLSPEAKAALDAIKAGFEQVKTKQDELEKQLKTGKEDVITKNALDAVNTDLTAKLDDLKKLMEDEKKEREGLESRLNKRGAPGEDTQKLQQKLNSLNITFKAHARDAGQLELAQLGEYKSGIEKILRRQEGKMSDAERKAIYVGSDPAGGFFITPDTSGDIVRFINETSAMRSMAMIRTIGTDAHEGKYKLGNPAAAWVGETQTRSETGTQDYGKWRIEAHELYAWPEISLKALEDSSIDMEAELASEVAGEFGRKEETAFFTGDGVGKPRGILTYTAGTPANTSVDNYRVIRQTNTGANGAFAGSSPGDIFHTVIGQTKRNFLGNANWVMNRTTLAATRKLKDGDGTYLWEKSFQDNQPFQLLGYPVELAEDMPAIATNSLSIGFGDFNQAYRIVDRIGISTLIDPYTSTTGFVRYKTRRRVGGDVVNHEAYQLVKFAA